jgi:hypothetical protein
VIVWLASYPRSGNTFARVLLFEVFGIASFSRYAPAATAPARVSLRVRPEEPEPGLEALRDDPDVHVVKTHEPAEDDRPAIYIVRDGRDALVSHAHYVVSYDWEVPEAQQADRFVEALDLLIDTDTSFGGWGGNVTAWLDRRAPTTVVRFEDLVASPVAAIQQALAAVDIPRRERQESGLPAFAELQRRFPRYFRRGRIGAWRDDMSEVQHARFWQRHGGAMRRAGYAE